MVPRLVRGAAAGAAAGAAGTTALDAVTYLDMAWRGRPASTTPERSVEAIARRLGRKVPGDGETRQNRLTGLGALSGAVTGVGVGAVLGGLRALGIRPPRPVGALLIALATMAATNGSMARLGVTDLRTWSAGDWLSDLVPHLAFGAVTAATLDALDHA